MHSECNCVSRQQTALQSVSMNTQIVRIFVVKLEVVMEDQGRLHVVGHFQSDCGCTSLICRHDRFRYVPLEKQDNGSEERDRTKAVSSNSSLDMGSFRSCHFRLQWKEFIEINSFWVCWVVVVIFISETVGFCLPRLDLFSVDWWRAPNCTEQTSRRPLHKQRSKVSRIYCPQTWPDDSRQIYCNLDHYTVEPGIVLSTISWNRTW